MYDILNKEQGDKVIDFCNYVSDYVAGIRSFARDGSRPGVVDLYHAAYETLENLGTYLELDPVTAVDSAGASTIKP